MCQEVYRKIFAVGKRYVWYARGMAGRKTSVYLSEELSAQVEASGMPLAEILRRGLTADEPESLEDMIRRVVRDELRNIAEQSSA